VLTVGLRICHLRRQKRVTQAELAGQSGIPQPNLSRIERGEQDPTVSTLLRICSSLEISPAEFFQKQPAGTSFRWTRSALERLARAVTGSSEKLTAEEKKIVEFLKDEIPGCRRRLSSRRVYQSWSELRQSLSREEIRALVERIHDARQRSRAFL